MDPLLSNTQKIFKWNKREKRGVMVLLFFLVVSLWLPDLLEFFLPKSDMEVVIDFLPSDSNHHHLPDSPKATLSTIRYHLFDPNRLAARDWLDLGIPLSVAERIEKFLKTGARFSKKEDLIKIYGMKKEWYENLKPWIQITPPPSLKHVFHDRPEVEKKHHAINIHFADTLEWRKLRGIGRVLANRIVKYRNALGGFVSPAQLLEVYGINDSLYQSIQNQILWEPSANLQQLDLNQASMEEFREHPYFRNRNLARNIVKFREVNGPFLNLEDLKKVYLVNDSIFEKVQPYLKVLP